MMSLHRGQSWHSSGVLSAARLSAQSAQLHSTGAASASRLTPGAQAVRWGGRQWRQWGGVVWCVEWSGGSGVGGCGVVAVGWVVVKGVEWWLEWGGV